MKEGSLTPAQEKMAFSVNEVFGFEHLEVAQGSTILILISAISLGVTLYMLKNTSAHAS
jgi:uncharacterized protein (DUF697 family)